LRSSSDTTAFAATAQGTFALSVAELEVTWVGGSVPASHPASAATATNPIKSFLTRIPYLHRPLPQAALSCNPIPRLA
jgi:hypothetical protein